MKLKHAVLLCAILLFGGSCKKNNDTTPTSRDELIKLNGWALSRITTLDNQTISNNKLNTSTILIFALDIQFKDNNVVRASDKVSKQVINAGTWFFIENNQKIDVNVTGFKGQFEVTELSKSKLVLKNKVPVSGVETDALMEFIPNL